jgi:hypothetical protein
VVLSDAASVTVIQTLQTSWQPDFFEALKIKAETLLFLEIRNHNASLSPSFLSPKRISCIGVILYFG